MENFGPFGKIGNLGYFWWKIIMENHYDFWKNLGEKHKGGLLGKFSQKWGATPVPPPPLATLLLFHVCFKRGEIWEKSEALTFSCLNSSKIVFLIEKIHKSQNNWILRYEKSRINFSVKKQYFFKLKNCPKTQGNFFRQNP